MLYRAIIVISCFVLVSEADAQLDSALRKDLLVRFDSDQIVRTRSMTSPEDHPNQRAMTKIDSSNTAFLKEEIRTHGWPAPERVGPDGVKAAFFFVQHSPDPAFQEKMLPILENEADRNRIDKQEVAMLLDRVLVHRHEQQIYGSQFEERGSVLVAYPILDEMHVDERRLDVGMLPIGLYAAFLNYQYHPTAFNFVSLIGQIGVGTGTALMHKLWPF